MATSEIERPVRPSVLDRLIDDDPRSNVEPPLTRSQSVRQFKTALRRDLEWLLNARRVIIELTPQALTLVAEGTVMLEREVAQVLSGLPPGEAQQLNQRLRALVDRFPDPAQ